MVPDFVEHGLEVEQVVGEEEGFGTGYFVNAHHTYLLDCKTCRQQAFLAFLEGELGE